MKKIILFNRISTIENALNKVMGILRNMISVEVLSCKYEAMCYTDECGQTYDNCTVEIEIKAESNYLQFTAEELSHVDSFIVLEDENGAQWYFEEYLNSVFC